MARVIAVASSKGGVGKTALVQNLGASLAASGNRVLLIDFDPQHHLSRSWGKDYEETVYEAMITPSETSTYPIRPSLTLIPSSMNLAGAELYFTDIDRHHRLKDVITAVANDYDTVLIDTPPSLGFLTVNALIAADEIFHPLQPHLYAFEAIDQLIDTIDKARRFNPNLHLSTIILSMYDRRTSLTFSVEDVARKRFGNIVAQTVIPVNIRIVEATLEYMSVSEFEPTSTGAQAYRALTEELWSI